MIHQYIQNCDTHRDMSTLILPISPMADGLMLKSNTVL